VAAGVRARLAGVSTGEAGRLSAGSADAEVRPQCVQSRLLTGIDALDQGTCQEELAVRAWNVTENRARSEPRATSDTRPYGDPRSKFGLSTWRDTHPEISPANVTHGTTNEAMRAMKRCQVVGIGRAFLC